MSDARLNLLFVMTDHQRADSIGMVQGGVEVCPNLNALAAQGVKFDRAYTTCPLCTPARTALNTGKYPTKNGVVYNDWRGDRAGDHALLHECLARSGYEVAHVGVNHVRVRPGIRERVDFALWADTSDYARYAEEKGIDDSAYEATRFRSTPVMENQGGRRVAMKYSSVTATVWPFPEEDFKDNYLCRRAVEFLRRPRGEGTGPFALFLKLWAPHPPLRLPEPWASRFDPSELDLPPNVGVSAEGEPPGRRMGISAQLAEGVDARGWREAWAAHLGLVSLADAAIGRVLAALEETGEAGRTLVVFTVDHGDQLGQHRMYQKMEMYEPAVRVPLIVRAPGAGPRALDGPVSHLDILPTLADCLGFEPPQPAEDADGLSLAGAVNGGDGVPERPVFSQYSGNPGIGDIRRAIVTRRWKYVYDPDDSAELYDLEADPLEMTNLAAGGGHADVVGELHAELRAWHEARGDWVRY